MSTHTELALSPSWNAFVESMLTDHTKKSTQPHVDAYPHPNVGRLELKPTVLPLQPPRRSESRLDHHRQEPLAVPTLPGRSLPSSKPHLPDTQFAAPRFAFPLPPSSFSSSQSLWLCLYFFFNLSLTIYNKKVLIHFPFPYALTATHAFCGAVGSYALVAFRAFKPQRLTSSEKSVVILFSVLYSINIVVSNMSLGLVTVPVHQVIRASCPVFTIIFSAVLLNSRSSRAKIVSLVPVMIGVGLATYGDYYFTPWGFFLTVLGTVLAALKTIFTNVLQSPPPRLTAGTISPVKTALPAPPPMVAFTVGKQTYSFTRPTLSLKPLSFLYYLSPLAFFQCVGLSIWTGEFRRIQIHYQTMDHAALIGLLMNGAIAFLLNVVSFNTNKKVGPLGMTVAANVKQALTILVAVAIFNLTITATNGFGILLTLVGGAWYAKVEYQERLAKKNNARNLGGG